LRRRTSASCSLLCSIEASGHCQHAQDGAERLISIFAVSLQHPSYRPLQIVSIWQTSKTTSIVPLGQHDPVRCRAVRSMRDLLEPICEQKRRVIDQPGGFRTVSKIKTSLPKERLAFLLFLLVMQVQPFLDQIRLIFCSRDGLESFLDVSIDPVQVSDVSVVPKAGIAIAKARDVVRRVTAVEPERGRKVALHELDGADESVGGECRWSRG
jgi:hypothetical protein